MDTVQTLQDSIRAIIQDSELIDRVKNGWKPSKQIDPDDVARLRSALCVEN